MQSTLMMLRNQIKEDQKELTIDEISDRYKKTRDKSLLSLAFEKLYYLTYSVASKYYLMSEDDKASIALTGLDSALLNYNQETAKFSTFYISILFNAFRTELIALSTDKRRILYNSTSYEELKESGYETPTTDEYNFEVVDLVEKSDLSATEKLYCSYIMQDNGVSKDSEIAVLMGISRMGVGYIKKRVKEKLEKYFTDKQINLYNK